MYWDALHRQVRVEGRIVQMPAAESDAYFATRNWQSRLGAWASQQSEPIASRSELLGKVAKAALRLALPVPADEQQQDPGLHIARPPHWGGYRLWAEAVELWVEGSARIHDRARWQRDLEPASRWLRGRSVVGHAAATLVAAPGEQGSMWRNIRLAILVGILFFVAVGSWLDQHRATSWAAHGARGRVPGQRRRQCGRGRTTLPRLDATRLQAGQRLRGARGAPLRSGDR